MHFDSSGELDPLSSSSGNTLSVKGLQADPFQVHFSAAEGQRHRGHTTGTMTRHSHAFSRINALIAALSTPRIARTNSLWNYELEGCSLHTLMLCAQPTCQITLFKVRPVKELKSLGEARLTRIQVST